jgi:putative transposase
MIETVREVGPGLGIAPTCAVLGLPTATYYRRTKPQPAPRQRPSPPRALPTAERAAVLEVLHEPQFVDQAPAQVYAQLLDAERTLCSQRTMYRILDENHEVRERRDQLRHPHYPAPELLATAPNQVWSWDITKLLGPAKWTYFYLYVIMDIFSRYVVGWMVAHQESAALARKLIEQSCRRQGITPGQLTLHADHGPSMTSKSVALLLSDLAVTKTHSRPYVSNDNPFSEAQFKTMKYRPQFPERFGSIQDSRSFGHVFFPWYNTEHHHSGLGLLTPPRGPLRACREAGRGAGSGARRRLRRPSRALRHGAAPTASTADRGLDQQAEGGARRAQARFGARDRDELRAQSPVQRRGGLGPDPAIPPNWRR